MTSKPLPIIFAVASFAFFLAGMTTGSPFGFIVALCCGALSRSAMKKGW